MKMIIAILKDSDCDPVIQALTEQNFRVTRIGSSAVGKPSVLIPNLLQRQFTATQRSKAWVM